MSGFGKSVQFEVMTARENQYGLYVNDRWQVNDKLTVNAGLRWEYYPLMSRDDRGLEQLNLQTFNVALGGVGGNADDLGIKVSKGLFAPRVGAAYRINDDTVFRAGYGRTFNPLPWSRPMRGFYPLTIAYSGAGPNGFIPYGSLAQRHPGRAESGRGQRQRAPAQRRRHALGRRRQRPSAARSTRGTCSSSVACRATSR